MNKGKLTIVSGKSTVDNVYFMCVIDIKGYIIHFNDSLLIVAVSPNSMVEIQIWQYSPRADNDSLKMKLFI